MNICSIFRVLLAYVMMTVPASRIDDFVEHVFNVFSET